MLKITFIMFEIVDVKFPKMRSLISFYVQSFLSSQRVYR